MFGVLGGSARHVRRSRELVLGAAGGALANRLPDEAIDESFVRDLTRLLGPNSSALFALVRRHSVARVLSAPDKVVPERPIWWHRAAHHVEC